MAFNVLKVQLKYAASFESGASLLLALRTSNVKSCYVSSLEQ